MPRCFSITLPCKVTEVAESFVQVYKVYLVWKQLRSFKSDKPSHRFSVNSNFLSLGLPINPSVNDSLHYSLCVLLQVGNGRPSFASAIPSVVPQEHTDVVTELELDEAIGIVRLLIKTCVGAEADHQLIGSVTGWEEHRVYACFVS